MRRIDPRPPLSSAGQGHAEAAAAPEGCIAGGGEMGALIRAMDWSKTGLGPVSAWPQSLRTSVSTCLNSRFPILLWWGPKLVMLYNDAYRGILGTVKHPMAMGTPGRDVWPEVWHIIGPMLEGVLATGEATWSENQLLLLERHGFAEECYFTFSYSAIRDESGGIGGIFCAVTETTGQILSERRLRTLRDLAEGTAKATAAEEACRLAADVLREDAADLPFALVYLLDRDGNRAHLAGVAGLPPDSSAAPLTVDLSEGGPEGWPLAEVVRTAKAAHVDALERRFGVLPMAAGVPVPSTALVLPVGLPGDARPSGFLVAALTPRLSFGESYQGFLELVAGHIATALAGVRALQEARERAEALAELDRAKTAFFSNISHEFRTPLTLMLSPLEDLLGAAAGALSPSLREELEVVHRNAVRLLKLVNTLLDFSRIEAGRVQVVYEATDLARLTADLASVFRPATEKAALRLAVDCPPLPRSVCVDREMWEKIVLNLVSNAFKFTFEGEIGVALRWGGDHVELEVRDTGTGILPQELPHIFRRFHRVEGARARTHEGSGIGLALVQELVRLHRGVVRVDSVIGKGTTFTISIPTGTAPPADAIDPSHALAPASAGTSAFVEEALSWLPGRAAGQGPTYPSAPLTSAVPSAARILVADDNADMREYVCRILSPRWSVEAASDGAAALLAARRSPPDLVLTDVMMPALDGFGLLRELRADPRLRTTPVVVLSARAGEEARVEGLEAGADDYLIKPFSARELTARVASQLAFAKARREADKEREARIEALQRTVRVSEMFVGILSHDLRNPLSAISTSASLLVRRGEESDKIARPAIRILNSADRMQRMIGQLLDFTHARLGTGIPLQRSSTDLAKVCCLAIEELEGEGGGVIRFESSGDTVGEWDRDRLAQLGSNLLGNAVAHGQAGSPVELRLDGHDPDVLRLEVRNRGVIAPEILPDLFEPFRSSREKREGASGLGLGLYIANQIVLSHGGTISVRSSEPDGTAFTVELPRRGVATERPDS